MIIGPPQCGQKKLGRADSDSAPASEVSVALLGGCCSNSRTHARSSLRLPLAKSR